MSTDHDAQERCRTPLVTIQRAVNGGLVVHADDGTLLAALPGPHDLAVWIAGHWPEPPGEPRLADETAVMPTILVRSDTPTIPTRPAPRGMFSGRAGG